MAKVKDELRDLRSLTVKQLSVKITDSRKKLVTLNQDKILGKLKNAKEINTVRKLVARANTVLDEKIIQELN